MARRDIADLREQRARAALHMRTMIDTAEQEDRDFTGEEQQEYDRTETDFDSLTGRVKRAEKDAGLEPVLTRESVTAPDEREHRTQPAAFARRLSVMDAMNEFLHARGNIAQLGADARKVLQGYVGIEQRAPYAVGADATGGVTVPEEWSSKLVEVATQFGVVERLAENITTTHNGQLHIDRVVEPGTAVAAIVAEGGTYTESEDTFEEVLLDAYKYGHLAKASDEIVEDSQFDLNSFIQRRAGRAIALKSNTDLMVGDGSSKPRGLMTGATVGVTLAAGQITAAAIDADEIIDLYHSLPVPYRGDAVFILHDATLKVVRKLKENGTTGQYLWQPGLQSGEPDRLLGRPVFVDPDVAVSAASAKVIYFGDVSRNYVVRSVTPVRLKVLTELYAGNGYVGFRVDRRLDGDIQDTAAGRTLAHPAS